MAYGRKRRRYYKNRPYKAPRKTYRGQPNRSMYKPYRGGGFTRKVGYYGRFTGPSGEMKFKDTVLNDAVVAEALQPFQLLTIPEGNGESERIGRKITIKKVHIRGVFTLAPQTSISLTATQITAMVVQDTQTNGIIIDALDLLEVNTFDSFRNLAESQRFKILYRETFILKAHSGGLNDAPVWNSGEDVVGVNINLNVNIPIEYNNDLTDGTITTIRSNNIYFVTLSNSGIAASEIRARVRYTDC